MSKRKKEFNIYITLKLHFYQPNKEKVNNFKEELKKHFKKYFDSNIRIETSGYHPWQKFEFSIYTNESNEITFPEFDGEIEVTKIEISQLNKKIPVNINECLGTNILKIGSLKKFIHFKKQKHILLPSFSSDPIKV